MRNRVKEIREAKGLRQADVNKLLNAAPSYIGKIERGEIKLSSKNMPIIAEALGVEPEELIQEGGIPILGNVQAGTWLEVDLLNQGEHKTLPFSHDPRYPNMNHFAVNVVGDSMNKVADDGAILICLSVPDNGLTPQEGDLVIAEQIRGGDLREVTVKRLCKEGGNIILKPESTNPAHLPIKMNGGANTRVSIIGLVIGHYNTM